MRTEPELDYAVFQVVKAVIEIGLPIMSAYDTLDKVRHLFREDLARSKRVKVAVLFAQPVGWVEPFAKPIAFAELTVEKKLFPTRMFR